MFGSRSRARHPSGYVEITQAFSPAPTCSAAAQLSTGPWHNSAVHSAPDMMGRNLKARRNPSRCYLPLRCVFRRNEVFYSRHWLISLTVGLTPGAELLAACPQREKEKLHQLFTVWGSLCPEETKAPVWSPSRRKGLRHVRDPPVTLFQCEFSTLFLGLEQSRG